MITIFSTTALRRIERKLDGIERKLDALMKHQGVTLPPLASMSGEVQQMARDPARKIAAIKLHREQTGLGLAGAKDAVEDFIRTIQ